MLSGVARCAQHLRRHEGHVAQCLDRANPDQGNQGEDDEEPGGRAMTQNKWRQQFLKLEEDKGVDLQPHVYFNRKLHFLTSAVGFDAYKDDYFYPLLTFEDPDDDRNFVIDFLIHFANEYSDENNLPKRLFVRCGAITTTFGYPDDAKYNWKVFDNIGRAKFLTSNECDLFGLDYYDGTAPEGLVFTKNLQSDIYKKFSINHKLWTEGILRNRIFLPQDELNRRDDKWKHEWKSLYNAYLNSSEWKEKRAERLAIDSWHCSNCDKHESEATLQVHHLTYKNVGDEYVGVDLVTLCIDCHQQQHGRIFA
jgi:hypothetical protein